LNISLQREISSNLVVEAAYVASRSVWLNNSGIDRYQRGHPGEDWPLSA
jgi:hypothetical protein